MSGSPASVATEQWSLLRQLLSTRSVDLVPRLTLLVLLPHAAAVSVPATVVAYSVALAIPRVYRSPLLWIGIAGYLAWVLADPTEVNEHDLLAALWALTLSLAFLGSRPERTMARAGALLLGLTFAFATFGKAASPDFRSGDFFRFEQVADPRFAPVAVWAGGLPVDDHTRGREAFLARRSAPEMNAA